MTAKVKVTREVAEAIDRLLNGIDGTRFNKYGIIACLEDPKEQARFPEFRVLSDYYYNGTEWESPRHPHVLMQALVLGYEVEMTPEDKIRSYYDDAIKLSQEAAYPAGKDIAIGRITAIRQTLIYLGIKYEGVNA